MCVVNTKLFVPVGHATGPDAPRQVSAFLSSSTNVQLSWLPPLNINGLLLSYAVSYSENKMADIAIWSTVTEPGKSSFFGEL